MTKRPDGAAWWRNSLTRREAAIRIAATAGAALGGAAALAACTGRDDLASIPEPAPARPGANRAAPGEIADRTDPTEPPAPGADQAAPPAGEAAQAVEEPQPAEAEPTVEASADEVAADDAPWTEPLALDGAVDRDSLDSMAWRELLDPAALVAAIDASDAWAPFAMLALAQSLHRPEIREAMRPVATPAGLEARSRGKAIGELVAASKDAGTKLLVIDLPGEQAVAAAAGMAPFVQPVFLFDNEPHPRGVVPSQQTLGALLYWGAELRLARRDRSGDAPVVFVLDRNRLAPYRDEADRFDNRYMAEIPGPDLLKERGIRDVLYVVPEKEDVGAESDDLNDPFVALHDAGVGMASVPMASFVAASDTLAPGEVVQEDGADGDAPVKVAGHYYGGSPHTHGTFFSHFPLFLPLFIPMGGGYRYGAPAPTRRALPAPPPAPPAFRPVARPTMFSSRTAGGLDGVGSRRPAGFGRVTVRQPSGAPAGFAPSSPGANPWAAPGRAAQPSGFGTPAPAANPWGRPAGPAQPSGYPPPSGRYGSPAPQADPWGRPTGPTQPSGWAPPPRRYGTPPAPAPGRSGSFGRAGGGIGG